jgi:peptide/nickel transport system substrate-binding protein
VDEGDDVMGKASWRGLIAFLAVGTLLVGACSSDSDGAGEAGPESTEASSVKDPNGVLKVGYDLEQDNGVLTVDPLIAKADSLNNDPLWYLLYGRFVRLDADGELISDLAETAEVVDQSTIVIELKPDLVFSDGSPFDAAAVKESLEAVVAARPDNEQGLLPAFFNLQSVEATGPTTVTLTISDNQAASWYDTHMPTMTTSIAKIGSEEAGMPIGAGPYRLTSVDPGQAWVFEKNPNYWNAENVNIARIELVNIEFAQPQSGTAALQAGQVDMTFTEPTLLAGLSGDLESFARTSANKAVQIHICKAEGPLADAKVRTAINKGIDRQAISDAVYFGTAEPQHQLWPAGHRLNNPEVEETLAYDPDGARALLAEAGYADGFEVDLYPIQAFSIDEAAVVIEQQLADIGITVNIVPTTDYAAQFLTPNTRGIGMYPTSQPGTNKLNPFTGDSVANACDYNDPEITRLAGELRAVSENSEEAVQLWNDITDIVVDDALAGFVVWRTDLAAYDTTKIGDMSALPLGNYLVPDPTISYMKAGG